MLDIICINICVSGNGIIYAAKICPIITKKNTIISRKI